MKPWSEEGIRDFGREVTDLIASYYASLEELPITAQEPADLERLFGGPFPEQGSDPFQLLAEVRQKVLPQSFHIPSPRYFGLFNPTPTVIGVFADAIASMLNQNMAAWCHGPAGTQIEATVIKWLCDLAGFGPRAFGTLTSGGSIANLTGLKVALNERMPEVRRGGIPATPGRPAFYVSSQAHYSLTKVADMMGIGIDAMRIVPCDDSARILPDELSRQIEEDTRAGWRPFCVVGIAGTTTSGAVDPLPELAGICERHGLWYHVDAAWGAAILLSAKHRRLLAGIDRADSIAVDPHKWFSVPFAAGGILMRDGAALRRAFEVEPHYVSDKAFTDHEDLNLFQFGMAGSRRLDALKVWLSLRQYGSSGYARTIERHIELAESLAERIRAAPDFEMVTDPSLAVLCFRHIPAGFRGGDDEVDALQMTIQQEVERRGRAWISTSLLAGRRVIRACISSHLTREPHLDLLVEEIRRAARAVTT